MLIKDIDLLEQVMDRYSTCLGSDLTGYRNHVYRVINLCCLLSPSPVLFMIWVYGQQILSITCPPLGNWQKRF